MLNLIIPPPIYLLTFALLMWLCGQYVPMLTFIPPLFRYIGLGMICLALVIDIWSLGLFFKAKTTFNPLKPSNTTDLVTTGSYCYSRNPMYLGMVIILFGWGMWLGSLSPFLLIAGFVWVITEQQIKPEERILLEKFGQQYQQYQQQVRRWL